MKRISNTIVIALLMTLSISVSFGQVAINNDGSAPANSSILDIKSTTSGVLFPRMTTQQRNSIDSPVDGLFIFNISTMCFDYYFGGSWKSFCGVSNPVFQCGMQITDERDLKNYNTVQIGSQCWMAQNLNIGIRIVGSIDQSDNNILEKYCYLNLESNCETYGGLYQWDEMMLYNTASGQQGICPSGWHLPTDTEWTSLIEFLGGIDYAGAAMKTTGTLQSGSGLWNEPNEGANNSSGFSVVPGGSRHFYPEYDYFSWINNFAYIWTSTLVDNSRSKSRDFLNETISINVAVHENTLGCSVRCVKD